MTDKVLYVDDDLTAQLIFKLACRKAGFAHDVVTATNGQQALDYYEQLLVQTSEAPLYPELIFLDLDMPVMGGWEFLQQFITRYSAAFPNTKVFIVSSTVDPAEKQRVRQYTCVLNFLPKPITVELLTEVASGLEAA